jgi:hypothetical protein
MNKEQHITITFSSSLPVLFTPTTDNPALLGKYPSSSESSKDSDVCKKPLMFWMASTTLPREKIWIKYAPSGIIRNGVGALRPVLKSFASSWQAILKMKFHLSTPPLAAIFSLMNSIGCLVR